MTSAKKKIIFVDFDTGSLSVGSPVLSAADASTRSLTRDLCAHAVSLAFGGMSRFLVTLLLNFQLVNSVPNLLQLYFLTSYANELAHHSLWDIAGCPEEIMSLGAMGNSFSVSQHWRRLQLSLLTL